jgi:hypothetical protein
LSTCTGQAQKIIDDGLDANCLWGKKSDGLAYARDNKEYLYGQVYKIAETHGYDSVTGCADVVQLFMAVPNLGMVKAAFVAQCLGFNVSCIDSHNIKRLGISPNLVKSPPSTMKPATVRKKIVQYVELCQDKGTEYWWDTWCNYVAGNQANRKLNTGDIVSYYHVECVTYGFEPDFYSSY